MLGKKSPVGSGSPRPTSTNRRRRRTFRVLRHRIDTRRRVNLESGSRSGTPRLSPSMRLILPAGSFDSSNASASGQ